MAGYDNAWGGLVELFTADILVTCVFSRLLSSDLKFENSRYENKGFAKVDDFSQFCSMYDEIPLVAWVKKFHKSKIKKKS